MTENSDFNKTVQTGVQIPPFLFWTEFANIYLQKTKFNLAVDEKIHVSRKLLESSFGDFSKCFQKIWISNSTAFVVFPALSFVARDDAVLVRFQKF
jgi:hypothetical protein